MIDQVLYCRGPGRDGNPCGLPVAGHGDEVCSTHRRQLTRSGKMTPIAEKLTPEERMLEAGNKVAEKVCPTCFRPIEDGRRRSIENTVITATLKHLEADGDTEYEQTRKALIVAAKQLGRKESREAIRLGLAAAKESGTRLGRPPAPGDQIRRLFKKLRSGLLVAKELGISDRTVRRHLNRRGQ